MTLIAQGHFSVIPVFDISAATDTAEFTFLKNLSLLTPVTPSLSWHSLYSFWLRAMLSQFWGWFISNTGENTVIL